MYLDRFSVLNRLRCESPQGFSHHLDSLEERGWITIEGDTPATTEQGNYAVARWLTHKLGRRVVANLAATSMRAVRTEG